MRFGLPQEGCVHACVGGGVLQCLQHPESFDRRVTRLMAGFFFLVLGLTWDYFYIFLTRSALGFGSSFQTSKLKFGSCSVASPSPFSDKWALFC